SEILPPKTDKMALLVGNEGNGVTDEAAALCYRYRLPMPGKAESLNAAVFGAIMLYELMKE
ncbi:MAG: RNA methyltransferase, partial [Clostridia bacterium]|nr:RNA methyltransferase [Clostridia bacterium]